VNDLEVGGLKFTYHHGWFWLNVDGVDIRLYGRNGLWNATCTTQSPFVHESNLDRAEVVRLLLMRAALAREAELAVLRTLLKKVDSGSTPDHVQET